MIVFFIFKLKIIILWKKDDQSFLFNLNTKQISPNNKNNTNNNNNFVIKISTDDFISLMNGNLNLYQAIITNKLIFIGNNKLNNLFSNLINFNKTLKSKL